MKPWNNETMKLLLRILTFIIIFLILAVQQPTYAESLTVSASIGTNLTLQGYTSPNSLVVFLENGTSIGTTTSDSDGSFTKNFNNQDPGIHTIYLYSTDSTGANSATVSFQVLLIDYQTITVSNIYLPPTITLSKTSYSQDDIITISGYSKPSSLVKVEFTGTQGKTANVSTNSVGYYLYEISGNDLSVGNYQVKSTLEVTGSNTATTSEQFSFSLSKSTVSTVSPTASPTKVPSPTPIPCPYFYSKLCFFDKAKLGFIDIKAGLVEYLIGFSKYYSKIVGVIFDINEDQLVDSIDLSIILFHTKADPSARQILGTYYFSKDAPAVKLSIAGEKYSLIVPQDNSLLNNLLILLIGQAVVGVPFLILFLVVFLISNRKNSSLIRK